MIGEDRRPGAPIALDLDEISPLEDRPTPRVTPPHGSPAAGAELSELAACYQAIGPRARGVLLEVARRLRVGAVAYGDDFRRPMDARREAGAEVIDAVVYLALEIVTR